MKGKKGKDAEADIKGKLTRKTFLTAFAAAFMITAMAFMVISLIPDADLGEDDDVLGAVVGADFTYTDGVGNQFWFGVHSMFSDSVNPGVVARQYDIYLLEVITMGNSAVTIPNMLTFSQAVDWQNGDNAFSIDEFYVRYIGDYAFYENAFSVASVNMSSLTRLSNIGEGAFSDCTNLTTVTFPTVPFAGNKVIIDEFAFFGCTSLTTLTNSNGNIKWVGPDAFNGCTSLATVNLTGLETSTPAISTRAFAGCTNLTTVNLPTTGASIGIESMAFYGCVKLVTINLQRVVTIGESAFSGTNTTNTPQNTCPAFTSVNFNAGGTNILTTIGKSAFEGCRLLTTVTLPTTAVDVTIGEKAFFDCPALTTITNMNRIKEIGNSAFSGTNTTDVSGANTCAKIVNVSFTAPGILTNIGSDAFNGCRSLASVYLPSANVIMGNRAFANCFALEIINLGNITTNIPAGAFQNCKNLVGDAATGLNLTAMNATMSVGFQAFSGCTSLTKVSLPPVNAVTIQYQAFDGCTALEEINTGNVTSIGYYAFQNCTSLVGDPVNGLDLSSLSATLSISYGAFRNCSALEYAFIGKSVQNVTLTTNHPFLNCAKLLLVAPDKGDTGYYGTGMKQTLFYDTSTLDSVQATYLDAAAVGFVVDSMVLKAPAPARYTEILETYSGGEWSLSALGAEEIKIPCTASIARISAVESYIVTFGDASTDVGSYWYRLDGITPTNWAKIYDGDMILVPKGWTVEVRGEPNLGYTFWWEWSDIYNDFDDDYDIDNTGDMEIKTVDGFEVWLTKPNGDIALGIGSYGVFSAIVYTVSFNLNGGAFDPVIVGNKIEYKVTDVMPKVLPIPIKFGYDFVGWNTAANGTGDYYSAIHTGMTGNLSLNAIWTPKDIEINIDTWLGKLFYRPGDALGQSFQYDLFDDVDGEFKGNWQDIDGKSFTLPFGSYLRIKAIAPGYEIIWSDWEDEDGKTVGDVDDEIYEFKVDEEFVDDYYPKVSFVPKNVNIEIGASGMINPLFGYMIWDLVTEDWYGGTAHVNAITGVVSISGVPFGSEITIWSYTYGYDYGWTKAALVYDGKNAKDLQYDTYNGGITAWITEWEDDWEFYRFSGTSTAWKITVNIDTVLSNTAAANGVGGVPGKAIGQKFEWNTTSAVFEGDWNEAVDSFEVNYGQNFYIRHATPGYEVNGTMWFLRPNSHTIDAAGVMRVTVNEKFCISGAGNDNATIHLMFTPIKRDIQVEYEDKGPMLNPLFNYAIWDPIGEKWTTGGPVSGTITGVPFGSTVKAWSVTYGYDFSWITAYHPVPPDDTHYFGDYFNTGGNDITVWINSWNEDPNDSNYYLRGAWVAWDVTIDVDVLLRAMDGNNYQGMALGQEFQWRFQNADPNVGWSAGFATSFTAAEAYNRTIEIRSVTFGYNLVWTEKGAEGSIQKAVSVGGYQCIQFLVNQTLHQSATNKTAAVTMTPKNYDVNIDLTNDVVLHPIFAYTVFDPISGKSYPDWVENIFTLEDIPYASNVVVRSETYGYTAEWTNNAANKVFAFGDVISFEINENYVTALEETVGGYLRPWDITIFVDTNGAVPFVTDAGVADEFEWRFASGGAWESFTGSFVAPEGYGETVLIRSITYGYDFEWDPDNRDRTVRHGMYQMIFIDEEFCEKYYLESIFDDPDTDMCDGYNSTVYGLFTALPVTLNIDVKGYDGTPSFLYRVMPAAGVGMSAYIFTVVFEELDYETDGIPEGDGADADGWVLGEDTVDLRITLPESTIYQKYYDFRIASLKVVISELVTWTLDESDFVFDAEKGVITLSAGIVEDIDDAVGFDAAVFLIDVAAEYNFVFNQWFLTTDTTIVAPYGSTVDIITVSPGAYDFLWTGVLWPTYEDLLEPEGGTEDADGPDGDGADGPKIAYPMFDYPYYSFISDEIGFISVTLIGTEVVEQGVTVECEYDYYMASYSYVVVGAAVAGTVGLLALLAVRMRP